MNDEGKKVGKRILTIAGAVAGTCVISAGTFLLADSGLAFVNTKIEKTNETEKMSELNSSKDTNAETELIAKSKDSFIISQQKESNSETNKDSTDNNKDNNQSQDLTSGEGTNNTGTDGSGTGNSGTNNNQGTSQGGTNTGDGSTGGTGSSDTGNNGYVDNGTGNYSDGNTGYDDGNSTNAGGSEEEGGSGTITPVDPPQTEAPVPPQTEAPVPPEPDPPQTEAPEPGWDDTYVFSDSNERYISESELQSMSMEDIAIARNEIFARNGRIFSSKKWIEYFSTKSWYVPQYDQATFDSMDLLNAYEKANLKVILAYEEKIG